jgi:hypothetical protein
MPEDNENAFGERTGAADLADSAADRSDDGGMTSRL